MKNKNTPTTSCKSQMGEVEVVKIPVEGKEPLHGELYRANDLDAPRLLWLPAMGVPASYYAPFASALAKEGLQCLVLDLRGQGKSHPLNNRRSLHGYRHLIEADIPAALTVLREMTGSGPLLSGGHSLGGHIALLHAASNDANLAGLVFVAAQLPYYAAYPKQDRFRMWFGSRMVKAVSGLWGYWPGHRFGFGGRQPRPLVSDWARIVRTGRWASISGGFDERRLEKLALPVLAVSIAGDKDAPPPAVERLCAPLLAAEITRWHHLPMDPAAGDHLRWARREAAPTATHIAHWVENLRTGSAVAAGATPDAN